MSVKSDSNPGKSASAIDEMAIVDVFIKTILNPNASFNPSEKRVITALRKTEAELCRASVPAIGEHLDGLSPDLMKNTVLGVKRYL